MSRVFAAHVVVLATLLLAPTGCAGGNPSPSASEREAVVLREAPKAVAIAAGAVAGTQAQGAARWARCMAQPVWRYDGWARFTSPQGDRKAQLEAIRAALVRAGYADVTQVQDKVTVQRDRFVFSIGPTLPTREGQPQWKASFHAGPCSRFDRRDRARIEAQQHVSAPLPLGALGNASPTP
jgi:hypothetical protein